MGVVASQLDSTSGKQASGRRRSKSDSSYRKEQGQKPVRDEEVAGIEENVAALKLDDGAQDNGIGTRAQVSRPQIQQRKSTLIFDNEADKKTYSATTGPERSTNCQSHDSVDEEASNESGITSEGDIEDIVSNPSSGYESSDTEYEESAGAGAVDEKSRYVNSKIDLKHVETVIRKPQQPKLHNVELYWKQGGQQVFVTGTFTGWKKMIKLLPARDESGKHSVKLQLPSGNHRFRFIVDNELRYSDDFPTATDNTGNFVNYIEIVDHKSGRTQSRVGPLSERSCIAMEIGKDPDDMGNGFTRFHEDISMGPKLEYTDVIPPVFIDPKVMQKYYMTVDRQKKHNASSWLNPPQLPPQLETVILNKYGEMNSDGSKVKNTVALPIPNHAVLNHLVTSSIKHNTLCVASNIRYRQKYVTQIYYYPLQ